MMTEEERKETLRRPRAPRAIAPMPTFPVYENTRVTYGKHEDYSDGVKCVARHGGEFGGMVWLPRGWFIGDPIAPALAYAAMAMAGSAV